MNKKLLSVLVTFVMWVLYIYAALYAGKLFVIVFMGFCFGWALDDMQKIIKAW